jgi:hypothetical protein
MKSPQKKQQEDQIIDFLFWATIFVAAVILVEILLNA